MPQTEEVLTIMREKILIADDETPIADLAEEYLKNDGYEVFKYYNATDALACVKRESLSPAILDVMLTAKAADMHKITGLKTPCRKRTIVDVCSISDVKADDVAILIEKSGKESISIRNFK